MVEIRYGNFFNHWQNLEPESFDLILSDPPYNCLQKTQPWDVELDWGKLEMIFANLLKPNGQIILFCNSHLFVKIYSAFNNILKFRYCHYWEKQGMPVNPTMPIQEIEIIALFKKRKGKHLTFNKDALGEQGLPYSKKNNTLDIPTRRIKKSKFSINQSGKRYPRTIIKAPSKPNMEFSERTNHPTQKPLALIKRLLLGYSNEGDRILDPFCGSGTTLIACYDLNRDGIGYEIENEFYIQADKRINNHTAQLKLI